MIQKIIHGIINSLYFICILLVVGIISTVSLTNKINTYTEEVTQGMTGTVIKDTIPVLSYTGGIVQSIQVRTGQEVKKGDSIAFIDNPSLRGKVSTLRQFPDNVSAQTEADVAEIQLSYNNITAPVDGIIGEISVKEFSPIEQYTAITTMYAHAHTRVLSYVTNEQLKLALSQNRVAGYSSRLNQEIMLVPDILHPVEQIPDETFDQKKIGLYFALEDSNTGMSLLDNEDLHIVLTPQGIAAKKPIDYIVTFWNSILGTQPDTYVASK